MSMLSVNHVSMHQPSHPFIRCSAIQLNQRRCAPCTACTWPVGRRHCMRGSLRVLNKRAHTFIWLCLYGAAVCLRDSSYVISTSAAATPAATAPLIHTPPASVQLRLRHARQQCIPSLSAAPSPAAPAPAATISRPQVAAVWLWQHCSGNQHWLRQQPSPATSPAPAPAAAPSLHPPAASVQLWLQHASWNDHQHSRVFSPTPSPTAAAAAAAFGWTQIAVAQSQQHSMMINNCRCCHWYVVTLPPHVAAHSQHG